MTVQEFRELYKTVCGEDLTMSYLWKVINDPQKMKSMDLAGDYALRAGQVLTQLLKEHGILGSDIAIDALRAGMTDDYRIVADFCDLIQQQIYDRYGIGLKPQRPILQQSRIDGLVTELTQIRDSGTPIDDLFFDQIINASESVADNSTRYNAEFLSRCGYNSAVKRYAEHGACKYCLALAGTHDAYEPGVWKRHTNCHCTIDYIIEGRTDRLKGGAGKGWR